MNTTSIIFPIKDYDRVTEEEAVLQMIEGLKKLVSLGALKGKIDDFVQNYKLQPKSGWAVAYVDKDAVVDPSHLQTVGAGYSYEFDLPLNTVLIEDKNFSVASIKERVRINGMPVRQRFRYIILDYKRYFNQNKKKILKDKTMAVSLRNMFLMDLMSIFNDILPFIQEGKQLATLTGISTVSKDMTIISKDLSLAYRKSLNQLKNGGQISKTNIQMLQTKYAQFMDTLVPQVFPEIETVISETKVKSDPGGPRLISIEQDNNSSETLYNVIDLIKDSLHRGDVKVSVDSGKGPTEFTLSKSDNLVNLNQTKVNSPFTYTFTNSRIKLF